MAVVSASFEIVPTSNNPEPHAPGTVECSMSATWFRDTAPDLLPILRELLPFEPIFHTRAFGLTSADFGPRMSPEYWEVGASGRRYSREFILDFLSKNPPVDAASAEWKCSEHALGQLGPDTYLVTYTLSQGERLTRRSTIWRKTLAGWRILYHQGTIASSEEHTI